jgi:hypothetical protein
MTRRVFVDSTFAAHPRAACRLGHTVFALLQDRKLEGCVSPVILSNLFYILRQGMPAPQRVLPVDEEIIGRALASSFSDFEDAIQYYTAVEHRMSGARALLGSELSSK